MAEPLIIGLCGYALVGKDTRGVEGLKQLYADRNFFRVAFADAIKRDLQPCIDALQQFVPNFNMNDPETKKRLRPLYVTWGTEVARSFEDDIWIVRAIPDIDAAISRGQSVVVSDVRNPNEVVYIYDRGGYVVYIDRPGYGPANPVEAASIFDILLGWPVLKERSVVNEEGMTALQVAALIAQRITQQQLGEYRVI